MARKSRLNDDTNTGRGSSRPGTASGNPSAVGDLIDGPAIAGKINSSGGCQVMPRKEWEQHVERGRRSDLWHRLIMRFGSRYAECLVDNFEVYHAGQGAIVSQVKAVGRNLPQAIRRGMNMILFGPCGTGKDHLMVALLRSAVLDHGFTAAWRNAADLWGDARDRIGSDQSESSLVQSLIEPDVLAISDPVPLWGSLTEFRAEFLYRIVDGRYRHNKPTWMTVNVNAGQEAAERIGQAVVSRLRHDSLSFHCDWPDYRSRKPVESST